MRALSRPRGGVAMTAQQTVHAAFAAGMPHSVVTALERYVNQRVRPHSEFVQALITNDLQRMAAYAPKEFTMSEVRDSVRLVFNFVPGRARGSSEAMDAWVSGATTAPDWPKP